MKTKIIQIALFSLFILACSSQPPLPADYPAWVQDAVFYQIFPERFRNGDPGNDPTKESLLGSYPHDHESAWQVQPWGSDWYKLQPWEEANGKGFSFNAQRRRYGGDLQGIIDKLDYLSDLGINALYLNPIFDSPSLHKYDAATYIHVDVHFGPNPQKDRMIIAGEVPDDPSTWQWTTADSLFLQLIDQAHRRGIKIVLDGVFNHVGIRHWAFLDLKEKGPDSKYRDWFSVLSWDDPKTLQDEFRYVGWMNVKELPEFTEDELGLIAPVKKHVFDIVERWMDPNGDGNPEDGIDGWRLDVAEMVAHNFWKEFRQKVKSINPRAYITGELFWEDWHNNKLMDPTPWLQGDQFDGTMNYRWSAALTNYFIDREEKITASQFIARLQDLDKGYPEHAKFVLMNLMDSHDTDRLSSNIVNPDLFYDKMISLNDNPYYDVRKPNEDEWRILRLVALFQFTYPGAAMVYYGTEAGMWGADDPDCRKPMVWDDLEYEQETANIGKTPRPTDTVQFDHDLFDYYQRLITIRNNEPALRRADFRPVFSDDQADILAFRRQMDDDEIIVVINNAWQEQTVQIPGIKGANWKNLLTDDVHNFTGQGFHIEIGGKQGMILKRQ